MTFQAKVQDFLKAHNIQLDIEQNPNVLQQKLGHFLHSLCFLLEKKPFLNYFPAFDINAFFNNISNVSYFPNNTWILTKMVSDFDFSKQDFDVFMLNNSVSLCDIIQAVNNDKLYRRNMYCFTPESSIILLVHQMTLLFCEKHDKDNQLTSFGIIYLAYAYTTSTQWNIDFENIIQMLVKNDKEELGKNFYMKNKANS